MSSFKKLNKADVTTVSYAANKHWSISYASVEPNDEYIVYYEGINTPFNSPSDSIKNNQYTSLVYDQINHLFYQAFTSSLDTGSIMFNVNTYESASSQRPTSSYFNYNTNPLLIKQFPTGNPSDIEVYSINQNIYGSKILPGSFQISSSVNNWIIKDDGNGNLFDLVSSSFVGNIFYAHGIIVNTNVINYTLLYDDSTFSFQNEHIVYENEVRCIVKESDFNLSYNPTLVTGSYDSGSLRGFATSASFQPYVTTIGLYNDDNELLVVAKLAKPIALSSDTDMTFIVKYDT
jgi:hypothetical protein